MNKRQTLKKPPRLRPGAAIGIAALSGAVNPGKLDAGIAYLRARGYGIVEAPNLRSVHRGFAGGDEERARGYRQLLRDPRVDAILFARGGWGAARVLPWLDPEEIAANPKIQMGGSDLTSLFSFLGLRAGLVGFHGPMVAADFARQPVEPETDAAWEPARSREDAFRSWCRSRALRRPCPRRGRSCSGRTSGRRSTAWIGCCAR